MYGKAFAVLIILLILIYNLATGSVETVASSNTESLTSWATYGTLVQAGAAILALLISVYTFWQQKEMTRRQINLSLYEKRYKIYMELQELLSGVALFTKDTYNSHLYQENIGDCIIKFKSASNERDFLLDANLLAYIDNILQEIDKYSECIGMLAGDLSLNEKVKNRQTYFYKKQEEVKEKFKSVLDFRNI